MLSVAVIGSGVVGQATGKGFRTIGLDVTFVDVNPALIEKLQDEGYTAIHADDLTGEIADVFFISVPTPTVDGHITLEYLLDAAMNLGQRVLKNSSRRHTIVVRSTVSPGTTEKLVVPILEEVSGKRAGTHFGVCMSPEYLRAESAVDDFMNPWLITVGALDDQSAQTLEELFSPFSLPVHRVTLAEAEAQKYVHNLFNAAKISFFNEMRMVCAEAGIDAEHIFPLVVKSCEGCWNPTYGTQNKGPFSGSCLPKDAAAFLSWAQHHYTTPMTLLKAVIDVNEQLKATLLDQEQEKIRELEYAGSRSI
jgi:UDPglucose 6-dehydrogenase